MIWRKLFPGIFLFTMVDGFIAYCLYPARLPFLYRDFLIIGVYILFVIQEPVMSWVSQLRTCLGGAWFFAISFLFIGLLQLLNPLSPSVLVSLLGFKVLFLNWPLAILAFAYVNSLARARRLMKSVVYFSIPISLFGLYQFWRGPGFMSATFGPGFERTVSLSWVEGFSRDDWVLRVIGTFSSTGQFSGFLIINAMLCLALLFSTKNKRERLIVSCSMLLSWMTMIVTGSRGGLIFLVLESTMFAVLCKQARRALVMVVLMGLSLNYGIRWLGEKVILRFKAIGDIEMIRQRTIDLVSAQFTDVFMNYPLGRGLGTASNASRHLMGESGSGWTMVENYLSKLQMETGIFGVLMFYLFMVVLSVHWLGQWKSLEGPAHNLATVLLVYCLTGFIIGGIFGGMDSPPGAVFLWAFIGMGARILSLSTEVKQ